VEVETRYQVIILYLYPIFEVIILLQTPSISKLYRGVLAVKPGQSLKKIKLLVNQRKKKKITTPIEKSHDNLQQLQTGSIGI